MKVLIVLACILVAYIEISNAQPQSQASNSQFMTERKFSEDIKNRLIAAKLEINQEINRQSILIASSIRNGELVLESELKQIAVDMYKNLKDSVHLYGIKSEALDYIDFVNTVVTNITEGTITLQNESMDGINVEVQMASVYNELKYVIDSFYDAIARTTANILEANSDLQFCIKWKTIDLIALTRAFMWDTLEKNTLKVMTDYSTVVTTLKSNVKTNQEVFSNSIKPSALNADAAVAYAQIKGLISSIQPNFSNLLNNWANVIIDSILKVHKDLHRTSATIADELLMKQEQFIAVLGNCVNMTMSNSCYTETIVQGIAGSAAVLCNTGNFLVLN